MILVPLDRGGQVRQCDRGPSGTDRRSGRLFGWGANAEAMRVGIVGQKDNERAAATVATVAAHLGGMGVEPAVDEVTASQVGDDWPAEAPPVDRVSAPVEAMSETDLVVSVGGDGTFLFAARSAGSTPIMGINLGEVGFLNAVAPGGRGPRVRRRRPRPRGRRR